MQHVFLKINPFVISLFFMLFSFDTAWQKSGGGQCPPGPPGFDATVGGALTIFQEKQLILEGMLLEMFGQSLKDLSGRTSSNSAVNR